jgi:hypothetical protein
VCINYAFEMGLGAVVYIPSFIMMGSRIQKLMGGKHIKTDSHANRQVIT